MPMTRIEHLIPGDLIDLEGDEYADPHRDQPDLEFEFVEVEAIQKETEDCWTIYSPQGNWAFPPSHKVNRDPDARRPDSAPVAGGFDRATLLRSGYLEIIWAGMGEPLADDLARIARARRCPLDRVRAFQMQAGHWEVLRLADDPAAGTGDPAEDLHVSGEVNEKGRLALIAELNECTRDPFGNENLADALIAEIDGSDAEFCGMHVEISSTYTKNRNPNLFIFGYGHYDLVTYQDGVEVARRTVTGE